MVAMASRGGGGEAAVAPRPEAAEEPQSSAADEWLLGVELPQPLKPALGSRAWASFSAALWQMSLIGVLAALGTLIEQDRTPQFYAKEWPTWSGIILSFGFDQMYSSPIFIGLLVWLGFSIMACTGTTQIPLAKQAQKLRFRSEKVMRRAAQFFVKVDCGAPQLQEGSLAGESLATSAAATRLDNLERALRHRGFVVRSREEDGEHQLCATRGLSGKFAPMVVHLSLLLVLLGGAAGIVFGASSEVIIGDGGVADIGQVLDSGRRAKGPLYEFFNPFKGFLDNTKLRVDNFRIEYRDDGEVDQFYSKLSVQDGSTKEQLISDEIYVNKPLRYGGATIYQADWGIDRLQLYVNDAALVVPLKPVKGEGGLRVWAAFLPSELAFAPNPSIVKKITRPDEGIVLVTENMRNVQVYGTDKNLAAILRSPNAKMDKRMKGMPVQFGEQVTVEGSALRLDKIVGSTGLIVKSDPGVPLVYLGFALMMPATLLSVFPFVEVWATTGKSSETDGNTEQLYIAGRANRNQPAFEDEMKAMIISGAL